MEDSGGMWLEEMEDSCYPFDKEFVESQLDACLLYTSDAADE